MSINPEQGLDRVRGAESGLHTVISLAAWLSVQEPFQGRVPNSEFLGRPSTRDFSRVKALPNSSETTGEAFPVRYPGPAYPSALPARPGHIRLDPFPYQLRPKLRYGRQKVQRYPAGEGIGRL